MKRQEYAEVVDMLIKQGEPFVVATVVRTKGSSLGKPGFKAILSAGGEVLHGTLGGACPDSAVVPAAMTALRTGSPKAIKAFLEGTKAAVGAVLKSRNGDEIHVETNCGGTMEVSIEPHFPHRRLILVGQGGKDEVEDALVRMARILGLETIVIDHSPMLSEQPDRLIQDSDYDLGTFEFFESDSVVVLTRGGRDVETLRALSKFRLKYVGMLASLQRARDDLAELREMGVREEFVASVKAPVGADIGAVTAAEIATSILSEVIATRYDKDVISRSHAGQEPEPVDRPESRPVDTRAKARRTMLLYAGYAESDVAGMGDLSAMTSERFDELIKSKWRRPDTADA